MRVPLSWLKDYVDVDLSPEELAHRLTMAGVEAGNVIQHGGWTECFVGAVMAVEPHPNADRLSLCLVDIGAEQARVVCGAPNVAAGQKICFAKVGAFLYNTHSGKHESLKPARIRGVVSEGMICSELELGLGEGHEGIVVLPEDAPVGAPLDGYLGDSIIELEITPNRVDCLSILGVAHEVGAITGKPVREPEVSYAEEGPPVNELASVSVADPDLVPRYTCSVIQGLTVKDSPQWLQDRLSKAGLRPINNVVDATNFVMLEFNQPLHAFDLDRVRDQTIIVRRAKPGETLHTLDGVDRELNPEVVVIADSRDPVGMGGVIGGGNSEISPDTARVLLESATFDSQNNRRTAETYRLRTDASQRFEKGLRPELAPIALRRATQLIQELAGGELAQGIIDIYPGRGEPYPKVRLTLERLKQVLGMELDLATVKGVLNSLGFATEELGPDTLEATVPYWRNDISIEEDLIEEVVRTIGYDSVPTTMLSAPIPYRNTTPMTGLAPRVKDAMAAAGMQEVISYPLVGQQELERVGHRQDGLPLLRVANPMNAEQEFLRPTLRASMLATLGSNEDRDEGRGGGPFRLFEVGRAFLPRKDDLPEEREMLCALLAGRRWDYSWLADDELLGFFDAKGMVSSVLGKLGIEPLFEPAEDPFFQPGRCAAVLAHGKQLGVMGDVHPSIKEAFDLKTPVVSFVELRLSEISQSLPENQRNFKSLSRYPAANRDLALVVPEDVPAGRVQEIISGHRLVQRVDLFDIYTGENVAKGTKSLAFHVDFQSHDRTLTAQEVSRSLEGLVKALERQVGASLRS